MGKCLMTIREEWGKEALLALTQPSQQAECTSTGYQQRYRLGFGDGYWWPCPCVPHEQAQGSTGDNS